jgi:hypothetical protein
VLFRTDVPAGRHSIRLHLRGTISNRDAIGASVHVTRGSLTQTRAVKSGSSYLSQSALPLTFGLDREDRIDRLVIYWPSGRAEEFTNLPAGRAYDCVEARGITPRIGF